MSTATRPFEPSAEEIERRYRNTRAAMEKAGLDVLIISGSEYTGFEGALRYMCGFHILHRYAYVVIPMDGPPTAVFPREATWVGDHTATFIDEQVKVPHCGEWMAEHCKSNSWKRVGVYGLDYIIPVRDYQALADAGLSIVNFDVEFDHSRAGKSEEELDSVHRIGDVDRTVIVRIQSVRARRSRTGVSEEVRKRLDRIGDV